MLFVVDMKNIIIKLGGVYIKCLLKFDATAEYFCGFTIPQNLRETTKENEKENPAVDLVDGNVPTVSVTEMDWKFWRDHNALIDPHLEFSSLTGVCSEALMKYNRAAFHAAAFLYGGKAWLIAAPSGVGKTTQLTKLCKLWPTEFTAISGDRPILELKKNGTVYVHPSPWNGKEEIAGSVGGFLAGIICLERGSKNEIKLLQPKEAGLDVYRSVIQTAESEIAIHQAAAFATELLNRVVVWRLTSFELPGSTQLLYEILKG